MAEYNNGRLQLPMVTLCAMTSVDIQATIKALEYSMRGIDFGDVLLITDRRPLGMPVSKGRAGNHAATVAGNHTENTGNAINSSVIATQRIRYEHTSRLNNIDDFNYKMVYELGSHIHTPYAMIIHADGFIVHPECWRDEFLDYDYIGAPWPLPEPGDTTTYRDPHGNICRVGNSVGIRSKRLMDFPRQANIPWVGEYAFGKMWYHEDGFICCKIRDQIEEAGMRIAPLEVARYFSHEHMLPETEGITPFAFHKWEGTNAQYPDFRKPTLSQLVKLTAHKVLGG